MFWLICFALILLAVLGLLPALTGKRQLKLESPRERNIAIAKERKTEILSQAEAGELNEDEKTAALGDLEASLAADLAISTDNHSANHTNDQAGSQAGLIAALLLIPLVALGMYQLVGTPNAPQLAATHSDAARGQAPKSLAELVDGLEKKVAENPDDLQGKVLLAETYKRLQRFPDAVKLYEAVVAAETERTPDFANVLSSYADAMIMANDQAFTPKTEQLLEQALELDPDHINALWLLGMAKAEAGNRGAALKHWQHLRPLLAEQPQYQAELDGMIASLGATQPPSDTEIAPQNSAAAGQQPLVVEVKLGSGIGDQTAPSDSVFIFARAESGPPMPLAASRKTVADLPITVELDDSMAMLPQMKLSQFSNVVVGARISKSGQATAQPGDFQSTLIRTEYPASAPIKLTISEQVE